MTERLVLIVPAGCPWKCWGCHGIVWAVPHDSTGSVTPFCAGCSVRSVDTPVEDCVDATPENVAFVRLGGLLFAPGSLDRAVAWLRGRPA